MSTENTVENEIAGVPATNEAIERVPALPPAENLEFLDDESGESAESKEALAKLQVIYVDWLKGEGYSPKIDHDGDVSFKHEGRRAYFSIDANLPEYLRLIVPNLWEVKSPAEHVHALQAANSVSRSRKAAKAFLSSLNEDRVYVSSEMFLPEPEDASKVLKHAVRTAFGAVNKLISEMNKFSE